MALAVSVAVTVIGPVGRRTGSTVRLTVTVTVSPVTLTFAGVPEGCEVLGDTVGCLVGKESQVTGGAEGVEVDGLGAGAGGVVGEVARLSEGGRLCGHRRWRARLP